MKDKALIGYGMLSMGMILAGSSVVVGKILSQYPMMSVIAISLVVAVIFVIPIAYFLEGPIKFRSISQRDWLFIFLQSMSGIVLFRVFMMLGLRYTSAINAGIMLSTTPAILAISSLIILKEKLSIQVVLGILLSVVGILLIQVGQSGGFTIERRDLGGLLLITLAVVSESLFTIFRKKQEKPLKPYTSTAIVMTIAACVMLPISFIMDGYREGLFVDPKFIFPVLFYGVMCSAMAYVCWFGGLTWVKASEAAGFTALMPVSSVLLAVLILKEEITTRHFVGIILILIALYLIISKKVYKGCTSRSLGR